jgi:hypothetical protein
MRCQCRSDIHAQMTYPKHDPLAQIHRHATSRACTDGPSAQSECSGQCHHSHRICGAESPAGAIHSRGNSCMGNWVRGFAPPTRCRPGLLRGAGALFHPCNHPRSRFSGTRVDWCGR